MRWLKCAMQATTFPGQMQVNDRVVDGKREKMRWNGFSLVQALTDKTAEPRKTLKWAVWSSPDSWTVTARIIWPVSAGQNEIGLPGDTHNQPFIRVMDLSQAKLVKIDTKAWSGDESVQFLLTSPMMGWPWGSGGTHLVTSEACDQWPCAPRLPRATGDNNGA